MAKKQLVMRVGALAMMGGAMALYAAQAGVLPGLDFGTQTATPGAAQPAAQPPEALAAVARAPADKDQAADAFVRTQTHDLPDMSGFAAAPEIALALPALASRATTAHLRPAAFSPAATLPLPGVPATVTEPPETEVAETLSPFGLPCGLDVTAEATEAAMIALRRRCALPCRCGGHRHPFRHEHPAAHGCRGAHDAGPAPRSRRRPSSPFPCPTAAKATSSFRCLTLPITTASRWRGVAIWAWSFT